MGLETLVIQGLTQVIKNLVISEATDLTADLVKNAVKDSLDDDQQELLKSIVNSVGSKL
jgi:hypothetical protein|tara:strand:+ start:621 stop:797 length:177 start_codon:yes stop_codon:yes gene_type:complete